MNSCAASSVLCGLLLMSGMGAAATSTSMCRRLHLRVSGQAFLAVLLRTGDKLSLDEPTLNELLSLLHVELPNRLPAVLEQRVPARIAATVHSTSLCARMQFVPSASSSWLVTDNASKASALSAVPYMLVLDVQSPAEQAPKPSTLAAHGFT